MLLRCCLLLAIVSCVWTKDDFRRDGVELDSEYSKFSAWPSVHNALLRIRREAQVQQPAAAETPAAGVPAVSSDVPGPQEGGGDIKQPSPPVEHSSPTPPPKQKNAETKEQPETKKPETTPIKSNETPKETVTKVPSVSTVVTTVKVDQNGTTADKAAKQWDLTDPGVAKRGLIVFGGFGLLAMAYFIFYRTKSKFDDTSKANGINDANQFRYGVLQSDDRRDNLELSRVPLTMDSDEEEDEDLEIFDLGQKKKSLSYVNLQTNDEDIVLSPREGNDRDDLLLDIEDANSDTLINWSNNGNKSIL